MRGAAAFLHMDFSLSSSPCAFRARCSDPLPEAGLTKAKLKYRNERVENLHQAPGGGGGRWGGGGPHFTSVSQSAGLESPRSDAHQSGQSCRLGAPGGPGPGAPAASVPTWTLGSLRAPLPPPVVGFLQRRLGPPGGGRIFLNGVDSAGERDPPRLWLTPLGVVSGSNLF